MKPFVLMLFLAILGGCAINANQAPAGPPAYREGYAGGCNSGKVAAGNPYYKFTKDVLRYGKDEIYKQGWDDGFATCKGSYEAIGRAMR